MQVTSQSSKDTLVRQLTFAPLFFIIVANMVGSCIFTTSGFIMKDVQNPSAMLLCWLLDGVLALAGALCVLWRAGGDVPHFRWRLCFFA